jgi:hypothetical protein
MKTTKWNNNPQYASTPTLKTSASLPTPEAIRQRAHQKFLGRGGAAGSELDDWLKAENELKQEGSNELKK